MIQQPTLKFLVVDDYDHLRIAICRVLKSLGYPEPDQARDGAEALEMLFAARYDFVISDISMPNMNGLELLKTMKGDDSLKHIPVILSTAHTAVQYRTRALSLGAAGFLLKPFDLETLEHAIRKARADFGHPDG